MGIFDDKSAEEEAYEKGQEDGSEDVGSFERVMTHTAISTWEGEEAGDAYDKGYDHWQDNQPEKKD